MEGSFMDKYNLLPDESVILKSERVFLGNKLGELILTNFFIKHIITKGVVKAKYLTSQYPINEIKVYDGKASVVLGKNNTLDIYLVNGSVSLRFYSDDFFVGKKMNKESVQFASKINEIVTGEKVEIENANNRALPGSEIIADTLKGTLDTFRNAFKTPVAEEKIAKPCPSCTASISGSKGSVVKCQYCNTEFTL